MRKKWIRSTWARGGPAWLLGAGLLASAVGCGSDPDKDLMGVIAAAPATTSGDFSRPFDTVPSSDASTFYFTAQAGDGAMAVYKVPAGGGAATALFSGAPLVSPFGIAISTDDKTLFIADTGAKYDPNDASAAPSNAVGAIFALSTEGGMPTTVGGTDGTRPRSIDVRSEDGNDVLYFSGFNDGDGQAAVFKIPAAGGGASVIAKGPPFTDLGGIAVDSKGENIYVANTASAESGSAAVFKITGGAPAEFISNIQVGYPAGVALSAGGKRLLVSGRDPQLGFDVVYSVNTETKEIAMLNSGIETNTDAAGLHRAKNSNVFSWADLSAGTAGTVYRVELK